HRDPPPFPTRRSSDLAKQIAKLFEPASPVLEQLLDGLFHIAKADGKVPPAEIDYLRKVATIFGFDEAAFERIRRTQLGIEYCQRSEEHTSELQSPYDL